MNYTEKPTPQEIREENKKIRMLRLMVDLTLSLIYQGNMTREEATEHFLRVKRFALSLFPGKEREFEIIYAHKFKSVITQVFGQH
ncbi:MAG TPA: hypothetical protein VLB01_03820 [Thermodesulfobacteriota bacterium]|nr:hypothetical protein [Thermodesulfobacteriota bacterium]